MESPRPSKAFAIVLLIAWSVLLGCRQASHDAPTPGEPRIGFRVGDMAPEFSLPTRDGSRWSLSQARGKIVMVNFWATWCGPCRMEMPSMEVLRQRFKGQEFELVAISEDEGWPVVDGFVKQNNLNFRVLLDADQRVARDYNSYRFPETFIIDRQGKIIDKRVGAVDWSHPGIDAYFKKVMAQK